MNEEFTQTLRRASKIISGADEFKVLVLLSSGGMRRGDSTDYMSDFSPCVRKAELYTLSGERSASSHCGLSFSKRDLLSRREVSSRGATAG